MTGPPAEITLPRPGDAERERKLAALVERFEEGWATDRWSHEAPGTGIPEDCDPAIRLEALCELVAIDLEHRLKLGQDVRIEGYLERFPELGEDLPSLLDLARSEAEVRAACLESGSARIVTQPGDRIGERYRLIRIIDEGGLGEVFRAYDREMSREVAIKRLRARFCDDPALVRRFRFEALLTGRLSHPGIVPVYATSPPDEPQPYFINQLVDGVTMERAIGQLHGAGAREVLGVQHRDEFLKLLRHFIAMCETVAYTHNRGVIHRDLKPRNVLLGSFGETFVIDWGLARPVEDMESWVPMERGHRLALREDALPGATSPDAILGTTQYSSPERVSGAAPRGGPVCDVYSLGATFYHLLTGRPPFDPELKLDALIERITQGQFARPREVVPSIPPPLEEICLQAMALRKSDRYAKAALLVRDLESWLDETTASALRPALPGRVMGWLWRQRRPPAGRPAGRGAGVPGDQRPERPHRRRRES